MAGIKINPAGVMGSSSMAESAMRVVGTVSTGISTVKWGMDSRILSRYEIGTRLGNIQSTLLKLKGDIQKRGRLGWLHFPQSPPGTGEDG